MSNDLHDEIRAAVTAMCRAAGDDDGPHDHRCTTIDAALWNNLVGTGFTLLGVPEETGGSGGDLDDAAVVVHTAARHLARVPLAETGLLSAWLLTRTGLPIPGTGPMTTCHEPLTVEDAGRTVSGRAAAPWARASDHVVVPLQRGRELLVAAFPLGGDDGPRIVPCTGLAGEPRDTLIFQRSPLPEATVAAPAGIDSSAIRHRGALARAIQLAGAAEAVLDMSLRQAAEREQFGRPLNRFQAVQHHLAALAADVEAMRTSAITAVRAVSAAAPDAEFATAAAKATTSLCAGSVAAHGHQVLGALGFTLEHRLGSATTRLWSWRDDYGPETFWQDRLGELVLAADQWWPTVVAG